MVATERVHPSTKRRRSNDAHPREQLRLGKIGGCHTQHSPGSTGGTRGEQNATRHRPELTGEIEFGDCEQGGTRWRDLVACDEE